MDPNQIDVVENGAIVKVFLLEGPFPWNAGDAIAGNAGPFWESFALTHAALGFVVEESQSKFVLELAASDYVGGFLPEVPPPPPTPAPVTPAPTTAAPTTTTPAPTPAAGNGTLAPATPSPAADTASPTAIPDESVSSFYHPGIIGGHGEGWEEEEEEGKEGSVRVVAGRGSSVGAAPVEETERGVSHDIGGVRVSGSDVGVGNGTTEVTWSNDAEVQVTMGFDDTLWVSANYVGKITGLLYNDIQGWANRYRQDNPAFQPIAACSGSFGVDGTIDGNGVSDEFETKGSADSYDFVWAAFERLASNGLIFDQEVVLTPKRTVMCLFPEGGLGTTEIVAAAGNEEVVNYYRRTGDCVRNLAAAAAAGNTTYPGAACASRSGSGGVDGWAGEGGVSVLLGLGDCLEGQENAFLYHNATSYLRVPLPTGENKTVAAAAAEATGSPSWSAPSTAARTRSAARLIRYAPALPPRPPTPPGGPDRAYIVYIAVAVAAVGFALAGLRLLYRRKQENAAYGRGSGGGHGSLFSSSAGAGWRSGGGAASDFGDFESVGGEYDGALFPADSYSSGGLSGSRSQGGGRMSNWRGSRTPPDAGPMEAETVQLKRPLLNEPDFALDQREDQPTAKGAAASRRNRGGGTRQSRGDDGDKRRSSSAAGRTDLSPPPFSRMLGTMGGGPPSSSQKNRSGRLGGGVGGGEVDHGEGDVDSGPFGHVGDDPFARGGVGRRGGRSGSKKDDEPEGDEVFC